MMLKIVENNKKNSGRKIKKIFKNRNIPITYSENCRFVNEIQKLFLENLTKKKVFIKRI
jgi:hypothetical protein